MSVTVDRQIGLEASKQEPCPLCGHEHYCYLIQNEQGEIYKAICQWTDEPPEAWDRTGTASDGRGIFTKQGTRRKRRRYPDFVQLSPTPKNDIPAWQDHLLDMTGNPMPLERHGKARELAIEYLYPDLMGRPVGKVIRRQWSDRRRVYEGSRKTKHVRPWHWVGSGEDGFWSDRGKGSQEWTLYRESEAHDEILRGGYVFAVAGEQAVETYRALGLVATTCQGGESNYRQICDRLKDSFRLASADNLKPVLVIHPDNDLTGESKFADSFLKACDFANIPAVVLYPLTLWGDMPPGGDIFDWVQSGISTDQIIQTLETQIDEGIERQEEEIRARKQRDRWHAPEAWQGELGYWKETEDDRYFIPKCDFDFQIERELASDDGGGFVLQVKRTDDRNQRRIFIKSIDTSTAQKFKDALKRAIGCNIICNLNNYEVEALIRVRLHEYRITRKGKIYRLIDRVGQQEDGIWVFKDRQFTADGQPSDEAKSRWVWNSKLTGEESTLPAPQIVDQDPEALKNLVDVMRRAFGGNLYPALLTLGYVAAGVHYQEIISREGAFPTLNLYGDPGSGKTTAAECALSLVGMHGDGMMCDISLSAAYERLKLSGSLLHCLDDPTRTPELNSFLKGFYNGKARVVRGREVSFNVQRPHSPMMVTSNHACGENDAATQSRLIRLFFARSNDGDRAAFHDLPAVQRLASGCLTQLIQIGYPAAEVHQLEQELVKHLPNAHIRIAKSLALVLFYATKVAALAQATEDIKQYVLTQVCTEVNDPDEAGDSLRDFLEKIFELQSRSKLGDWNMRWIEREDAPKTLAIYLPGVWSALDSEFKPAYNRRILEALFNSNGIKKTRQRFHQSEDQSKAYDRAKLNPRFDASGEVIPPNPPETTVRWCFELPAEFLTRYSDQNRSTRSTDPIPGVETPAPTDVDLLISLNQQEINKGQNRSTEGGESTPVDLFKRSTDPLVDLFRSTDSNPVEESVSAPKNTPVDLVDLNCADFYSEGETDIDAPLAHHQIAPPPPQEKLINQSPCPEIGDIVIPLGTATWWRNGSDKLPYHFVPKKRRQDASIPINCFETELFHQMQTPSKVLDIRGDRLKVLSQESARKSVFLISDVAVLKRRGDES